MYLPIMININDKKITIIGGGKVAYRKAKNLLEYDCEITVVSPHFIDDFNQFNKKINMIKESYNNRFIKDSFLVYAATSSEVVNKEIYEFCKAKNILCNVANDFKVSDFITPSIHKQGNLEIAVSTSGKSPSLTSKIISDLKNVYTEEYDEYIELLGKLRIVVKEKCKDSIRKKTILNKAINLDIKDLSLLIEEYSKKSSL